MLMPQKPTVLCPIDFSDQSRVALRYAALVADHFKARLLLVTVNDLLLVQAAAMAYDAESLELQSHQDLRGFYRDANLAARRAQTTSRMTSAPESQHQRSSRPLLTDMQIS
jgi:nucleotide-binding universal stress UspA family protein